MRNGVYCFGRGVKPALWILLAGVMVAELAGAPCAWSKEYRSISTEKFFVSFQKNGRIDVVFPSGEQVFTGAYPMVWLEGEKEPKPLSIKAQWSTREGVRDALGEGQGMLYSRKDCQWSIRVYVTKPFMASQVVFINEGKKPVRVKMLMPWCVGGKGMLSLGAGSSAAPILCDGDGYDDPAAMPCVKTGSAESAWRMALHYPAAGRSLVAGFLTHVKGAGRFCVGEPLENGAGFGMFQAQCVYDPPIEVPPGGQLMSELLYLSVAETNLFDGLERCPAAAAAISKVPQPRPFQGHGGCVPGDGGEGAFLSALETQDAQLKRYGWTHITIGPGWEQGIGDWTPRGDLYPNGLRGLVEQVHARGMTVGLTASPLLARADSAVLRAHPDWAAAAVSGPAARVVPKDCRVLDISVPGVREYVLALGKRITGEWGFDAFSDPSMVWGALSIGAPRDVSLTRMGAADLYLGALQDGFGRTTSILGGGPSPLAGLLSSSVAWGLSPAPVWRGSPESGWGLVDAANASARRSMYAPYWGALTLGPVPLKGLAAEQRLAWLTAAVLCGGAVTFTDGLAGLPAEDVDRLSRLLPLPGRAARPVDVMETGTPRIWHLPMEMQAGDWEIVGVFNWDEQGDAVVSVPLQALGLDPSVFYTVYDFWQDTYCGTAKTDLSIAVAPGHVRLLGLRRFENRPMLIASDRHFTQGALDHTNLSWDAAGNVLTGTFLAIANTPYSLRVLAPEGFQVNKVEAGEIMPTLQQDGTLLKIGLPIVKAGPVQWRVSFSR